MAVTSLYQQLSLLIKLDDWPCALTASMHIHIYSASKDVSLYREGHASLFMSPFMEGNWEWHTLYISKGRNRQEAGV